MSEDNSHNDNFENLFKRNDEEIDIPYREEDWEKLEAKLALHDAKLTYRRRAGFIAAAAILIISLLGYFTYDNYTKIGELNRMLDEQITANESSSGSTESQDTEGSDEPQLDEQPLVRPNTENRAPTDSESQQELAMDLEAAVTSDTSAISDRSTENENLASFQGIAQADIPEIAECINCRNAEHPNILADGSLARTERRVYAGSTDTRTQKISEYRSQNYISNEDGKSISTLSRFTIGLKAAPDLSTVGGLSNFDSPGYSLGIDIGYKVNKHITVSTGIMRNVVRYRASGGGGYNPPDYLTGGELPDQIDGVCVLLDIPLTVKYDVLNFSDSRIFATASLSSYIMLNEKYNFGYNSAYSATESYSYSGNTGTSHLMSNAGISIGFEMDLNSRWSLRAEPQIKIPIRQVGLSNVRLFSLGSFISLNYNL